MAKSRRGFNRAPGAPALPGAGRPPQRVAIRSGDVVRVARSSPDGYEHIGTGEASIERRGSVRIVLDDGSTIIITL